MQNKGINPFEQHVEKIAVAVGALAVAGVVAWQFVLVEGNVDVDGQSVAPGEVDKRLIEKAERLRSQLGQNTPSRVEFPAITATGRQAIEAATSKGVAPQPALAVNQPALGALIAPSASSVDQWYHEPAFAALAMVGAAVTSDALDVEAMPAEDEFRKSIEASSDRDRTWVTPVARMDLKGMRAELHAANPGATPPRLAIPSPWFNDSLYVVDLVFERQQLLPSGVWSDPVVVKPAPLTEPLRPELAAVDIGLRKFVFETLADSAAQMDIVRPKAPPTVNARWREPGSEAEAPKAASPEELAYYKAKRKADDVRAALAKLDAQLKKIGGELEPPKPPGSGGAGGPGDDGAGGPGGGLGGGGGGKGGGGLGGGGGGGLGGGGSMKKGQRPGADDDATRSQRISLTRRKRGLEKQIAELDAAAEKIKPKSLDGKDQKSAPAPKAPQFSSLDELLVWTHDFDVTPEATYRYRVAALAYNPFYARGSLLVKQQAPRAEAFTISTPVSAWGEPVQISPDVSFFVTTANPREGTGGGGRATVEVYRLLNGVQRRQTLALEPGDRIGQKDDAGGDAAADFTTDWFVVDVFEDLAAAGTTTSAERAAVVVLGRVGPDGQVITITRRPWEDTKDARRDELKREAEIAEERAKTAGGPDGKGAKGGPAS